MDYRLLSEKTALSYMKRNRIALDFSEEDMAMMVTLVRTILKDKQDGEDEGGGDPEKKEPDPKEKPEKKEEKEEKKEEPEEGVTKTFPNSKPTEKEESTEPDSKK